MSTIHNISKMSQSGLQGIQAAQRDWSPYVVHFTNWTAMKPLREAIQKSLTPKQIFNAVIKADEASYNIATAIITSGEIIVRPPKADQDMKSCVCLSECNLPGLINHAERFGRFGFVFRKNDLFKQGGRPCLYVDREIYGQLDKQYSKSSVLWEERLWGLLNVYAPPENGLVQDFSHEREWRVFTNLKLDLLAAILCPQKYYPQMQEQVLSKKINVPVIPIDVLHEWGA